VAFEIFWDTFIKINMKNRPRIEVKTEPNILRIAKDITEELELINRVYNEQLHVVGDFAKHLERLNSPQISDANTSRSSVNAGINLPDGTVGNAETTITSILTRRVYIHELQNIAREVSDQVRDLINLKNQQSSIMEAKYTSELSTWSFQQSRSIMVFTVITIIFLPLSFLSSVFGMNAREFSNPDGGNSMSLADQFKFLFPISLGIIAISTAMAFSAWIRSFVISVTMITWASFIEFTYLRRSWQWITWPNTPDDLYESAINIVRNIYLRKEREDAKNQLEQAKRLEVRNSGVYKNKQGGELLV